MKNIFVSIALLVVSVPAFADSGIECKVKGGSEGALAVAPVEFSVSEADDVSIYMKDEATGRLVELVTVEIEGASPWYGSQDIFVRVAGERRVAGSSEKTAGKHVFTINGCKDEESTTATYAFHYKIGGTTKSTGNATYECSCSLD